MAVIDDLHAQRFYHGTKADLNLGDLIGPGYASNFGKRGVGDLVLRQSRTESGCGFCAEPCKLGPP